VFSEVESAHLICSVE